MAGGLLDVLVDDDSLRSALLRTSAADHVELRKTCRRIREIIDGDIFVQERCEGGFAEISAVLVDPFERYHGTSRDDPDFRRQYNEFGLKGDCGDTHILAKILVDGKEAGEMDMQLLPMDPTGRRRYSMHEMGDNISAELQAITTLFFTEIGKPTRVKSVRDAYEDSRRTVDPPAEALLYISELKLKPPYRTTGTVCAHALRSLLWDETLWMRWTLAMYIPFGLAHMTKEELNTKWGEDEDVMDPHAFLLQKKPSQEYLDILDAKTLVDMRFFLRAGFRQVPETISTMADSYYVFCVPTFLESEMMSEEQALSLPIKTTPKPPPELSQGARELLDFVIEQCSLRQSHDNTIAYWQRPALDHPDMSVFLTQLERVRGMKRRLEETLATCTDGLNRVNVKIEELEGRPESPAQKQGLELAKRMRQTIEETVPTQEISEINQACQETEQMIEDVFQEMSGIQILNARKELESLDGEARTKLTESVAKHGVNIIREANVFHACISNGEQSLLELALQFIPAEDRTQLVNSLDRNGATPLMVAACANCGSDKMVKLCLFLINLGADKDIVDAGGMTALGKFRTLVRSRTDYTRAMLPQEVIARQRQSSAELSRRMEPLLMPSNGPTEADDAQLLEASEASDNDEEFFWDENGDDDDDET
jgi:hypothetical protein